MEGFMRFKSKTTINFNQGITVIYGENGSGKSTILDAILIAFYGKTYRTSGTSLSGFLTLKDLINKEEKEANIEIYFEDGGSEYIVEKKIKQSGNATAYLKRNGHVIAEGKEVTTILEKEIIGLDYDSFKNSVIIMQNDVTGFLNMTGSEKRNTLISILKLDEYDRLLEKSKQFEKDAAFEKANIFNEISMDEDEIKNKQKILDQIEKLKVQMVSDESKSTMSEIKRLKNDISKLREREGDINSSISSLISKIDMIKNQNSQNNMKIMKLENSKKDFQIQFDKAGTTPKCPFCFQEIKNPDSVIIHYDSEIRLIKNEIDENGKLTDQISNEMKSLSNEKSSILNNMGLMQSTFDQYTEKMTNEQIENESGIKSLQIDLHRIEHLEKSMDEKREKYEKIDRKLYNVKQLQIAYSQIPKNIILRITPYIETEASKIINLLSDSNISGIKIDKDNFKVMPIVNGHAEEIAYLSGAERVKVAISLRIGISNVISRLKSMKKVYSSELKTLLIDEADFGSLDESGIDALNSMFNQLKSLFDKIIIITHIKEIKENISENVINVSKTGNISSKISYEFIDEGKPK
jgi:DNA repair exonuclease SbcCD ATPase subunit